MEKIQGKRKDSSLKNWLKKGILLLILLTVAAPLVYFLPKIRLIHLWNFIVTLGIIKWIFGLDVDQLSSFSDFFFGGGERQRLVKQNINLRFSNIGGLHEAKEELQEIVVFFHNPRLFRQSGIKLPKGILLVGPPGNGKTLLARALAGECQLPFLFRSGSEFEEMLVGVGSRRVRELFREARNYPCGCIIFIDEIDSIGKKRGTVNSNDLTLNQLLNELDGFHSRENIVVVAATNNPQVLDSALLRPGRFDRQIYIPLPNLQARREIIKLTGSRIPFQSDVDLEEVAALTRGFSGAQIVSLFNEAALLSLRLGQPKISQDLIFEAHDRVLMGPSSTSHTISPAKKKIVAFHEAGHAVVGLTLPETSVKKITIVPRWSIGGYTWIDLRGEQGDDYLVNKNQILAQVAGFLGGRASEELIFGAGHITIGAYSDFKKASQLIKDFIFHYGMSSLGIIPTQGSFFSDEEIFEQLPEKSKEKIAAEREKILNWGWQKVRTILRRKKATLILLAEILLARNFLNQDEINYIFVNQTSPFTSHLNNPNHAPQKRN